MLIALSPTAPTRIGSAIYAGSALLLFTVSAVYHRGTWSPRPHDFLKRFDHANIFLLIAGSYTPFALLLLEGTTRTVLLASCGPGRSLGVGVPGALGRRSALALPPDLHRLGWAAVFFLGDFAAGAQRLGVGIGTAVLVLVARRRSALHARRRRLRLPAGPTRGRAGSGSTRSSTP